MNNKKLNFGFILVIYLLGIFMGALDTGIVTPARTIIQNNLMVNEKTGIWLITIYTLAYAASIPIMGKLADKFGRKYIYLTSIGLFGLGSLLCGLSQNVGSFTMLLISRAIQAIGGGGILPIASAEFGTTFPKEKRGMALGLVGGVFGIANIFGASVGSLILDIFGSQNWQYIFYINVPITLFILIAGIFILPNSKEKDIKKTDIAGILILTIMILSLLFGLKNIDFFNFTNTIIATNVYPFLLLFVVLIPIFILVEKKAEEPVINLSYFKNRNIIITFILSFITGVTMMGMIFVPQFTENSLKLVSGSGGYLVIILGLFAGVGAPFSGKLIDKFGVKPILGFGFLASILGSAYLMFVTANYPNMLNVIISLILIGLGMGFTMGTPLNYMMLENTEEKESNSALATLSLIRSIGTTIAPAIMIGFIANAGLCIQGNVMNLLPKEINVPALPYAQELTETFNMLKTNENTKEKFKDIEFPDLTSMQKIEIDINNNSEYEISEDLINLIKLSDITTIVNNVKTLSTSMFDMMIPVQIENIKNNINVGINEISNTIDEMNESLNMMQLAKYKNDIAINSLRSAIENMTTTKMQMQELEEALPNTFEKAKEVYIDEISKINDSIQLEFQKTLNNGFKKLYLTVLVASIFGIILLIFYKSRANSNTNEVS